MASPPKAGFFEHDLSISEVPYYAVTVDGAAHVNFMDVSVLAPALRWLGAMGPIEGERMIDIMNVLSQQFFETHVKCEATRAPLELGGFPEVTLRTNGAGNRPQTPAASSD